MRIRKRGLLLSSMLSQTTSDPQLQPTTSHDLHPIAPNTQSQPSDPSHQPPHHPPKILACKLTNTWQPNPNSDSTHEFGMKQKMDHRTRKANSEEASRDDEEEENGGGTRKQNIILAAAPVAETVGSTPLSSRQVDERWFDHVDKKIPATKRKGLDVEKTSQETPMSEKAKKMRSNTSKKRSATSVQQNDGEQDKAGNDDSKSANNNVNNVKKTNKRGGAIMEGSRCSRVNGRGWRCCQQTLVGYSLCEHHLGKGRLRSITNTKARAKMPSAAVVPPAAPHNDITSKTTSDNQPAKKVLVSSSVAQQAQDHNKETKLFNGSCYDDEDKEEDKDDDDDYIDEEMKKPLVSRKKRMKLGMVKARSLSSLLNQTNNAVGVAVAADDN